MKQLNSIQYLRALAALLVVYCHAIDQQMRLGQSYQQGFHHLQNFGAIGVDIFFVISGFIISYISKKEVGPKAALIFLKKRFIRINPAYYAASVIALGFMMLSNSFSFSTQSTLKTISILPIFESGEIFQNPILHIGWTLSFEWLFYLVVSLLMLLSVVQYKDHLLILILVVVTLLGILFPSKEIHFNFVTNPMILEFGFGILLSIIYKDLKAQPIIYPALLLAITAAFFIHLIYNGYGEISEASKILKGENVWQRIVIWGIPSATLALGLLFLEKQMGSNFFHNKKLLLLGDASYAIYLVHQTCFKVIISVLQKTHFASKLNLDFLVLILVCISVMTGILFHIYIEKKLISFFNKILVKHEILNSRFSGNV
ncbi:acyltransferase [Dyadobacter chenwenxiniae]|uniref:Acyltransferase n=1 Tax=Dyadobacter chenwenxiniae TaxID=2906456 RepID=A0A9X1PL07_9BACT|nr:acyltransferase [Dyadobacter chenwenxiniae]MCF0062716.1 acyltransferase [Dyadobacter chenwenxiniae]UON83539.1 acyltransferase [Dyadobacter chenwenxiniae]